MPQPNEICSLCAHTRNDHNPKCEVCGCPQFIPLEQKLKNEPQTTQANTVSPLPTQQPTVAPTEPMAKPQKEPSQFLEGFLRLPTMWEGINLAISLIILVALVTTGTGLSNHLDQLGSAVIGAFITHSNGTITSSQANQIIEGESIYGNPINTLALNQSKENGELQGDFGLVLNLSVQTARSAAQNSSKQIGFDIVISNQVKNLSIILGNVFSTSTSATTTSSTSTTSASTSSTSTIASNDTNSSG